MITKIKRIINEKRLHTVSLIRKIYLRFVLPSDQIDHLKPSYNCNKRWYGSSYGGFFIEPTLLNNKSIVYSFGIGKDISFDTKIINKYACKVYGFDPTPKSIEYIKSIKTSPLFHFSPYGISLKTGTEKFYLPANSKGVSASMVVSEAVNKENYLEVNMKSFNDICKHFKHRHIDLLKIDIEGSEYEIIPNILNTDITITQLLVEFHDRFFQDEIKSKKIIEFCKNKGFEVFASSLNYEEISFINTKYICK